MNWNKNGLVTEWLQNEMNSKRNEFENNELETKWIRNQMNWKQNEFETKWI